MAAQQTIDLGLDRLEPGTGPIAVAPPAWTGPVRLWIAAVLVLITAIALAGSASPPLESLAVVGVVSLPSGGDFRLFADATYTIGPATGGGSNIIAYHGDRARWFLSVHATSDFIVLNEAAGTTLVSFGSATVVRAVDSATGRIRWQRSRVRIEAVRGNRVLLVQITADARIYTWCAADTGTALWQRSVPSDWVVSNITTIGGSVGSSGSGSSGSGSSGSGSAGPSSAGSSGSAGSSEHIFAVSPSGDVRDLRLDDSGTSDAGTGGTGPGGTGTGGTGFEVAGHITIDPAEGARPLSVLAVGGTLVVIQSSESVASVGGYATSSYAPLWHRQLGTHDGTIEPNAAMAPCGVVICEYEGADATGVDPRTGVPLWVARDAIVTPVGNWLLVTPIGPAGFLSRTRVIDPFTGEVLLRLSHWSVGSVGDDNALFVTPALTEEITEVADLRAGKRAGDPPTLRLLGPVPEATSDCRSAGQYIACVTIDGQLKLWRRRLP